MSSIVAGAEGSQRTGAEVEAVAVTLAKTAVMVSVGCGGPVGVDGTQISSGE